MSQYLSAVALDPITPWLLFMQPYEEGIRNWLSAWENNGSSIEERVGHFVIGLCLLVPLVNSIALLILREYSFPVDNAPSKADQSARTTINSRQTTAEKLYFSEKDIDFLATQCLGLRHVSSKEVAQREAQYGFLQGCSLGLAPYQAQFSALRNKCWAPVTDIDRVLMEYKEKKSVINLEERLTFVTCFEKGVDQFIQHSFRWDVAEAFQGSMLSAKRNTTLLDVANVIQNCCFSVIDYRRDEEDGSWANKATDFSSWGNGLGRFPKESVPGNLITCLSSIALTDLGYSQKDLQQSYFLGMDQEVAKRVSDCYRKILVSTIRSMASLPQAKTA